MPGTRRGPGHRVAVVDELAFGIVDGQRRQPLHHRRRGHRHHDDPPVRGDGPSGQQFLCGHITVRQHHHLCGAGVHQGVQQLVRADRHIALRTQDLRALTGEQPFGTVPVGDGQNRPLPAPAPRRVPVHPADEGGDLDAARLPHLEGGLDRRTRVVGVDMHRIVTGPICVEARCGDRDGFADLVKAGAQRLDALGVTTTEQVHHLELWRGRRRGHSLHLPR